MVLIMTVGDRLLDTALSSFEGKGIFVKEIETSLLSGEVDLAVHSLKDLPAQLPPGLLLGAITRREDARDVLVAETSWTLKTLPHRAVIGTSSPRRVAQLRLVRPDLRAEVVRGNLGTRLVKLARGECQALVLAAAGLQRLGRTEGIREYLPLSVVLPAPGQGALGLEASEEDGELLAALGELDHLPTARDCRAERAFLGALGGGCQVPLGAWAREESEPDQEPVLVISGLVADPDGGEVCRGEERGSLNNPESLGERLADRLRAVGAEAILERVKNA